MVKVNFATSDFKRGVAKTGELLLKNRYFEQNPFLTDDGASLIARPGLRNWITVGAGPIRGLFSEPGTFGGDLFVVSYDSLYRVKKDGTSTLITSGLNNPEKGIVNMAITGNIDTVPEYLYIADGQTLRVYTEKGFAHNSLTGSPVNNDVIRLGDVYYKWTNGSVDTGTPDGTLANPWLVKLGITSLQAFTAMYKAINAGGIEGTDYSSGLIHNPVATADTYTSSSVSVRALEAGIIGNSIVTTETGSGISWSQGGTLVDGGTGTINQVATPDDVGILDVAVSRSFVVVVPSQGQGINGRFFWIDPGETTINPLNFATAESAPDPIYGVEVVGDQFWLPGQSTTETWYFTGNPEIPVSRMQGVVFDRGTWEGTAVKVKENFVITDSDGNVFVIGNGIEKVSTPDISERIRENMQKQTFLTLFGD